MPIQSREEGDGMPDHWMWTVRLDLVRVLGEMERVIMAAVREEEMEMKMIVARVTTKAPEEDIFGEKSLQKRWASDFW